MDKKNLMSQMVNPVNWVTVPDLSTEMLELSDENLEQIVGGGKKPKVRVVVLTDGTIVILRD